MLFLAETRAVNVSREAQRADFKKSLKTTRLLYSLYKTIRSNAKNTKLAACTVSFQTTSCN